jgi:hypothetical protein
LQGAAKIAII